MEATKKQQLKQNIAIIIVITILTAIGLYFLRNHASKEGRELMNPMDEASRIYADKGIKNCVNITEMQADRLITLNSQLQKYKEQHEITFLKLYTYHFTSSTLFLIFSILSAMALFVITQEGWKNTSYFVKTVFLSFTALASFFGLSLSTFEQKISIDQNADTYIKYDNLQKELSNFCATSMTIKGDSITFDKFHSKIMNEATNMHGFYLEFDPESIDTSKIFDLEKKE
ncbi:hypothetical protein H2O64_21580 [Kordia sp. YSTF-M3]|uniref:DUF4231 domain-containing protein n=1 Tax=Kordia aestuariivivens TaxID=2759037 RepID=A0ABR7QFC7_9FLAO|nr:hypothetical protein [Kordia aestuariivivens]MBC8757276.1 hypothetical protein [Kordia aestuariivivens]